MWRGGGGRGRKVVRKKRRRIRCGMFVGGGRCKMICKTLFLVAGEKLTSPRATWQVWK